MASHLVNPFRGHSLLGLLALLAGLVAFLGLGAWLMTAAAWPGTCDHDSGTRVDLPVQRALLQPRVAGRRC